MVAELVGDGDRGLAVEDYRGDEVDLAIGGRQLRHPALPGRPAHRGGSRRRAVLHRRGGAAPGVSGRSAADHRADSGGWWGPDRPEADRRGQGSRPRGVDESGRPGDPRLGAGPAAARHRCASTVPAETADRESPRRGLSAGWVRCSRCWPPPMAKASGSGRPRSSRISVRPAAVAPWDFTDAIDAGGTEKALVLLHRLLEGGDRHPLVVLAILHRHVQSLLRVDGPAIQTEAQAAEAMGIAPGRSTFPAKKALATRPAAGGRPASPRPSAWSPTPSWISRARAPGRPRPCSRCSWPGCAGCPKSPRPGGGAGRRAGRTGP